MSNISEKIPYILVKENLINQGEIIMPNPISQNLITQSMPFSPGVARPFSAAPVVVLIRPVLVDGRFVDHYTVEQTPDNIAGVRSQAPPAPPASRDIVVRNYGTFESPVWRVGSIDYNAIFYHLSGRSPGNSRISISELTGRRISGSSRAADGSSTAGVVR